MSDEKTTMDDIQVEDDEMDAKFKSGEFIGMLVKADRVVFDNIFIESGGKEKWKSKDKFIMATCTLYSKIQKGELTLFTAKGKETTRVEVIQVKMPAKRTGVRDAVDAEKKDPEPEPVLKDDAVLASLDPAVADHPVARFIVLSSKLMNAETTRDKIVAEQEKIIKSAQKALDSFMDNNWDVLKKHHLVTKAVEKDMKDRARIAEIQHDESRREKRMEMSKLELEASREK